MDASNGRERAFGGIDDSLCRDADVEFVVAFGSRVAGSPRPASDIDIAIKFDDELSAHERFQKRCFLSGDLQRGDAPFVDVADIETLPIEVAHAAVNGTFLCGDEQAFEQFKADTEAAFEANRDAIHRRQRAIIDRIAEEGLRG